MKSFEKITKTKYEPIFVHLGFAVYSENFEIIRATHRYKANSCIKCDRKFKMGETIGLASFKNIGNKVMCEDCAKEIM